MMKNKPKSIYGHFISEKRIWKKVSRHQLANKVGISNAYLSQLKHGIRLNPDP